MEKEVCCASMKYDLEYKCDIHKSPFDCPDTIIYSSESNEEFGILIHDGGSSYIEIKYCPWCGSKLKTK